MVETLVGMVMLGIIVTLTIMFINSVLSNPKLLVRGEALNLAKNEISKCTLLKTTTDTLYNNKMGNMSIKRTVVEGTKTIDLKVSVLHIASEKELIVLSKTILR